MISRNSTQKSLLPLYCHSNQSGFVVYDLHKLYYSYIVILLEISLPKMTSYRTGIGIMMLNKNKNIFVGKRSLPFLNTHVWQMPQGGIDDNESPEEALCREANEEIGTDNFEIIEESSQWLHYDLPSEVRQHCWKGKYIGQKQKWFLVKFLGRDEEINIQTEHPEFIDWKWITLDEYKDLEVAFKKDLYQKLLEIFRL